MTEAQEKKIRLKILKTIDEADQAKNPDGYATVMGGPQLDIRISQTTINQRGGGMSKYATIPKDIAQHGDSYGRRMASLGVHHHRPPPKISSPSVAGLLIRNPPSRITS